MDNLFTIIYYTSNQEDTRLEKRIQERILKSTAGRHIPIVSVSQKPIDFGNNICVGDVGVNDHNLLRQIQIACFEAKTPFVISAESDSLYPPEYFDIPPIREGEVYRYDNLIIWKRIFGSAGRKESSILAQVIDRNVYIRLIESVLNPKQEWIRNLEHKIPVMFIGDYHKKTFKHYTGEAPIISLKTGKGLRATTQASEVVSMTEPLPYWGSFHQLEQELFSYEH